MGNENQSLDRRSFLKNSGVLSLAGLGIPFLDSPIYEKSSDPKIPKITKVEAIRLKNAQFTWIRLHTDQGITGIGETYPLTNSQIGTLKDLSSLLIGKNTLEIERMWKSLYDRAAFNVTGGAEMRIISAINIAQWDILGKYLNAPIYQLLGGKVQDKIRVYNTTAGINDWKNEKDIEKIVKFLLDRGVNAMKIWPFDPVSYKNNGSYISPTEITKSLDWFKRIRDTAGMDMEIAVEFHARWNYPCAQRIIKALEPFQVMWIEDIMLPDNVEAYTRLAAETPLSICLSERLATPAQFRQILEAKACDIVMYDVTWCGGISSAKKISDLADSFLIPVAPHTYGGPILWYASMHVAASLTNLFIMESGYNFYNGVYPDYLTSVVVPENGFVTPPDLPGLGISINENIFKSGEASSEFFS
ncbi:MAG: mandelate racemase/muconate lactonizing enzyme family protein [Ginsengibacter sp.]